MAVKLIAPTTLVFFLFQISISVFGQSIVVVDKESGHGIEGVSLYGAKTGKSLTTNSDGRSDLSALRGNDSITLYHIGYERLRIAMPPAGAKEFRVEMMPIAISLGTMVISASKWEENPEDIPQRVLRIEQEEITRSQPATAADLLAESGFVFIQKSQQGGGSPMIRGFAANRVLLVVDGVRMNNATFRSGNVQNVISLSPEAIGEAEVILGPGSVLYGSDALGGVMDFHTVDPQFSDDSAFYFRGRAGIKGGTADRSHRFYIDYNYNVGIPKLAFRTFFSKGGFGTLRMGRHGPSEYISPFFCPDCPDTVPQLLDSLKQYPSAYDMRYLMQKMAWQIAPSLRMDYAYHYSTTSNIPRYDRYLQMKDGHRAYELWEYGPQVWQMQQLRFSHSKKTRLWDQMRFILAQQIFDESRITQRWGSSAIVERKDRVIVQSFNTDANKMITKKTEAFYGLEWISNVISSRGETRQADSVFPAPPRYPDKSLSYSSALYFTGKHHPDSNWTLLAGARYNYLLLDAPFDSTFYRLPFDETRLQFGALNFSMGAVYHPSDDWQAKVHAASGFRAPNIDDIGKVFDSEPGRVVVPNPDLKPEYAYTIEMGYLRHFSSKFRLELTGYHTFLINAMARRDFQIEGRDSIIYDGVLSRVQAIQNVGQGRIYGVETSLEIALVKNWNWKNTFSWQKGYAQEEKSGERNRLRHVAPPFGSSRIIYQNKQWYSELFVNFSGAVKAEELPPEEASKDYLYARDELGRPWSPSWWTLNCRLSWSPDENATFGLALENILDKRYRPYSSGIAAPGRHLKISFDLRM